MTEVEQKNKKARVPPRWFVRMAWLSHRRFYRLTGGRLGLWRPKSKGWGERLWARWQEIDKNLDGLAALRSTQTAVVVFEPHLE